MYRSMISIILKSKHNEKSKLAFNCNLLWCEVFNSKNESKKKYLLILPPIFYEEIDQCSILF